MIYSTSELDSVMKITFKEVNPEELDEDDRFFNNRIIICDFIAILMVKIGVFHSVIAQ